MSFNIRKQYSVQFQSNLQTFWCIFKLFFLLWDSLASAICFVYNNTWFHTWNHDFTVGITDYTKAQNLCWVNYCSVTNYINVKQPNAIYIILVQMPVWDLMPAYPVCAHINYYIWLCVCCVRMHACLPACVPACVCLFRTVSTDKICALQIL